MLKYLGPTGKALSGDLEKSRSLLGPARLLAQRCMDRLTAKGGQGQEFMQQTLADGSKLKALVIGGMGAPVAKVWIDTAFGEEEQEFFFVGCGYLETGLMDALGFLLPDPAVIHTNATMRNLYQGYGAIGAFGKFDIDPIDTYPSTVCSLDNPKINGSAYKLEQRKRGMTYIPASLQTGRMRAFVQAKYGNPEANIAFNVDQYDPWTIDWNRVNIDGRWLGCTESYTTGILADQGEYLLITIQGTSVTARKIEFTDCGKSNLRNMGSVPDPKLADVLEAYAFGTATWGDSVPVNGSLPATNTRRWGWKFSWSGKKASTIATASGTVNGITLHGASAIRHTASFEYDKEHNQIAVTCETEDFGNYYIVYPYILLWEWNAYYQYYSYFGNDDIKLEKSFKIPIDCFYGRSEDLTTVYVEMEKIDLHEEYDTGEGSRCERMGTLAWSRCFYSQHVNFRIRVTANQETLYDAHYAKVISNGSYINFGNGISYSNGSSGPVYSRDGWCGQSNPCLGWFPTTQHRAGFDRIMVSTGIPFFCQPRVFIAHPVADCEALYVGTRSYVRHPGYTRSTAVPYDERHSGVVVGLTIHSQKCGSWFRYGFPATPTGNAGSQQYQWQPTAVDGGVDGYDINVYAVLPDKTALVHSSQGYGGDTEHPPSSSGISLPNCNIESVAARVIPDLDWSERVDWGGWADFFQLAMFGYAMTQNVITARQSAYARDTFATAGFTVPAFKTDDTYAGSGSTFVGWA